MTDQPQNDDYYWNSYSSFHIHEEMLNDSIRTKSYMKWCYRNKDLFKDKVVLDVGCGTGILSLFCAKAGARKVYAVDASGIVHTARRIVALNNMSEIIEVIEGKIEDIYIPEQADIIISEWMGYCLYYESMLTSVLIARDRFLKEGGIMAPNLTVMKICGIEDAEFKEDKLDFWHNVYGFDFSIMKDQVKLEPLVDYAPGDSIVTDFCTIDECDIDKVKIEESGRFCSPFTITAQRDDVVHALVVHFDVGFTHGHSLWFSTGPDCPPTHWKQTVFYLDQDVVIYEGEQITGTVELYPNAHNPRELDIKLHYKYEGRGQAVDKNQFFRLQ
ncbi:hypothetical protein GEMRC1_005334 [Eukaryota sp. GEM-RC1]